eukprot:g36195.t1
MPDYLEVVTGEDIPNDEIPNDETPNDETPNDETPMLVKIAKPAMPSQDRVSWTRTPQQETTAPGRAGSLIFAGPGARGRCLLPKKLKKR